MIGQTVSHYRILEEIGSGGMGVVYKAEDLKLKRTVALKFLPPELTRDNDAKTRFIHEAQAASALQHHNVCSIHEIDETKDGRVFISMDCYEGETLKDKIARGPLAVDEAIDIVSQVAEGLAKAHQAGMVHRDIKPANIMITSDGVVKILDFGLAKLAGQTKVTKTGTTVGTVAYMSPEQATGGHIDARSDIFSLGVVLYEMLRGEPPFRGDHEAAILYGIVHNEPESLSTCRNDVPHTLLALMNRALHKEASERFAHASELRDELEIVEDLCVGSKAQRRRQLRLLAGARAGFGKQYFRGLRLGWHTNLGVIIATLAILTMVVIWRFAWYGGKADSDPGRYGRKILVLPMDLRGQLKGAAEVGRSFAEALAVNLSSSKDLRVLAVPAKVPVVEDPLQLGRFARSLGAELVLTGVLEGDGDGTNATLTVVDPEQNVILWGEQMHVAEGPLRTLASYLAKNVVTGLGLSFPQLYDHIENLRGSPAMAASPRTAEALGAFRRVDLQLALETTKSLIDLFPEEPDAYAMRAQALDMAWHADGSQANMDAIEDCLTKLDRVDPDNPYSEILRAHFLVDIPGKRQEAADRLSAVLARVDLTPAARAWILRQRSKAYLGMRDFSSALADLERAIPMDPINAWGFGHLSNTLRLAGRFQEALSRARQAVALEPSSSFSQRVLGAALASLGQWEEAAMAYSKQCELSTYQSSCVLYAIALLLSGHLNTATIEAASAASMKESAWGTYYLACFWSLLHDQNKALEYLQRSFDLGLVNPSIAADSLLSNLRDNPDFENMVRAFDTRRETVEVYSGTAEVTQD